MTDMNNNIESPTIKQRKGISAVWLVPIIALVFGGWIAFKALQEKGVMITIQFETAAGLVANKTEIRYKGLKVGTVRTISINDDLKSVSVEVEMHPRTEELLTDQAQFWYVTANVSMGEITGLDTLFSGSYINFLPADIGEGKPATRFISLPQPPPLDESTPGLHIVLSAPQLGSINVNSPVTFKQLNVGYVTSYEYDTQDREIDIHVFIEPEYAHLVKQNSRFWNASGIDVQASLSRGIKIKTQSLESLLFGGIAFENLNYLPKRAQVSNGKVFKLHDNHMQAQTGLRLILNLDWDTHMDVGVPIMFHGFKLGEITELLTIDDENQTIKAVAMVDPRLEEHLTDNAKFFIMTPQISLAGVQNLNAIMSGTIIGIRLSDNGEPMTEFDVFKEEPPFDLSEPGLHLMLTAKNSGSLARNTGIYYQKKKVGTVQRVRHINHEQVEIQIHIMAEYASLVNNQSRFWNASGFRIKGNLQSIDIQAESVDTIVAGGIAFSSFVTPDPNIRIENGDGFTLYDSVDLAEQQTLLTMELPLANNVKEGTKVIYQGREIGAVHSLDFSSESETLYGMTAHIGILPEFEFVLKENTHFWLVKPSLSLSGLSDTQAIFGGTYITVRPGSGKSKNHFVINKVPPERSSDALGLQLKLFTETASSIAIGSPISYKSLVVGQVDHIELTPDDDVAISITINEQYRHLITSQTRFYNAGGISVYGNLSDLHVKSESFDTILKGGISFYNSENLETAGAAPENQSYHLFDNLLEAEAAGFIVTIDFDDATGLTRNSKIKYKQHVIGRIGRIEFKPTENKFTAHAYLMDEVKSMVNSESKFWLTKANIAIVGMRHPETLLQGNFVTLVPGNGEPQSHFDGLFFEPATKAKSYGLNVTLTSHKLGSIKVGNPILYRQVKVGEVIGVDLSERADAVNIYININQKYAPLVTPQSKFWNYSGIHIDAGLFSGVKVDTDSMVSILGGGISFATPEPAADNGKVENMVFNLHPKAKPKWLEWRPQFTLNH